jgi:hypothetical protein
MSTLDIKYQMFISSTWQDLKEERNNVIETILKHNQFPIGMEMFNADNDAQWKVIKRTIDSSDLYILLIGHRYGSLTKDKKPVSYTEKEFNYAKRKGTMPVLAFIRDRHYPIDIAKVDKEHEKKLDAFIERVKDCGITVDFWTTGDDLAKKISSALSNQINKFNDTENSPYGWVKQSSIKSSGLSMSEMSILNNSNSINQFLEDTAEQFEMVNEDVEKLNFDEKGNCVNERFRTLTCKSDVTHTFMKFKGDKPGSSHVMDVINTSDFKIAKKLPYIICYQDEKILNFCILFGRILKQGETVKFETKAFLANFLSDLIDTGTGYINYKGLKNTTFKSREDILIFPNKKKFENMSVKLVQIFPGKILNQDIMPIINGNKKTFDIKYGMINDDFDIQIEFKLN